MDLGGPVGGSWRQTDMQTDRDIQRQTEIDRDRDRQRKTEADKDKQRQTDTEDHRQTEAPTAKPRRNHSVAILAQAESYLKRRRICFFDVILDHRNPNMH